MKHLYFFILLILFTSAVNSQSYKKVKIYIHDKKDIKTLYNAGLDFDHPYYDKDDNSIEVFLNDIEFTRLTLTNYKFDVLISDWAEYYKNLPKFSESSRQEQLSKSKSTFGVSGFTFGSMGGFYTLSEVNAKLDSMKLLFPNLITAKQSIGTTAEGRPIYMVKISDNPDVDEDKPEVLYTALHHAREPESIMQMIYFMYYLLENYNSNPSVKYLVDNRELFFIPVLNPDGYEYNRQTNPQGGGFWRKNRRVIGDGQYGIDLNRNYGPQNYWNAPNGGSAIYSFDETYRGTTPFSEPETQAVRDFLAAHKIKVALNYHTYSNEIVFPYGALGHETPDSATFREFARDLTVYNKYKYGTDLQTVGYSTRGNSDDYFYDGDTVSNGGKIFAMTPEVGTNSDGFWPLQNRIIPLAQENLYPNLYYAWVAGAYIRFSDLNLNKNYLQPGENIQLFPSFKNKGLKDASNITISLTSLNPFCTVNNNSSENINSILSRSAVTVLNPFNISVSTLAALQQDIKLLFIMSLNGVEMSRDTVNINVKGPALPVELQSFTAVIQDKNITLKWSTASENNNLGFEIERSQKSSASGGRSQNEIPGWKTIGFVKGKGTTTELSNYSFTDKNSPEGTSVYRLKQVDYNGVYKYSGVVEVNFASDYSLEQNYPNPFNPTTRIKFSVSSASGGGLVTLKIYDILGNEITTLVNEEKEPGKYEINFNASSLSSGIYLYELQAGAFHAVKQMLLLK